MHWLLPTDPVARLFEDVFDARVKWGSMRSCRHFLCQWEKLLHQPFLVGLEGFELLGFSGDQGVEAVQAVDDALLFGQRGGKGDDNFANH